jgi:hypothetical protein
MQYLLDDFCSFDLSLDQLVENYDKIGTEGFDVMAYRGFLEFARNNQSKVKLYTGVLPSPYALKAATNLERALLLAKARQYISRDEMCGSTSEHHSIFESVVSGRNRFSSDWVPTEEYKNEFQIKILKEASIAHRVNCLLESEVKREDKLFLVCNNVHMLFDYGVPEKIRQNNDSI